MTHLPPTSDDHTRRAIDRTFATDGPEPLDGPETAQGARRGLFVQGQ